MSENQLSKKLKKLQKQYFLLTDFKGFHKKSD